MKVGDLVRKKDVRYPEQISDTLYTIVEIYTDSIKLKHPDLCGHFTYRKENIAEVINESR